MESDFSVSFINVGSADCTLIKCGDKSVLIDGGTNLVTDKITAYLKRSSVTHLDAVIVSHPDSDHIGSLPDIIDEFGTDVVYFGKYSDSHNTPEYEKLVNSIKENNIKAKAVYLSLGDREEKTRNPVMATVDHAIRSVHETISDSGINTILEWNQGNHFKDVDIRMAKALTWSIRATVHG